MANWRLLIAAFQPERPLVAAEVVGQVLVGVDDRRRPAPLGGLGLEAAGAEDVVDVVVAVDGRPHRRVRPPRRAPGRRRGRCRTAPPVSSIASPSPVSMAFTEATEIIVRMPGAISSAARSSTGCTGWWAWTRSPSPFQCCSASSRIGRRFPHGRSVRTGARLVAWTPLEHLIVKRDGDITTVTLDRPEKRNALALDVMEELTADARGDRRHRRARRGARRQRPGVLGRPQLRRHGRRRLRRGPPTCSTCARG